MQNDDDDGENHILQLKQQEPRFPLDLVTYVHRDRDSATNRFHMFSRKQYPFTIHNVVIPCCRLQTKMMPMPMTKQPSTD